MTQDEKFKWINAIESKGLDSFIFDGINWWPLIRCHLFIAEEKERLKNDEKKLSTSKFQSARLIPLRYKEYKQSIVDYNKYKNQKSNLESCKNNKFCFISVASNYKLKDELLFNRYVDPTFLDTVESKSMLLKGEYENRKYKVFPNLSLNLFKYQVIRKAKRHAFLRSLFLLKPKDSYSRKNSNKIDQIIKYIRSFEFFKDFDLEKLYSKIDECKFHYDQGLLFLKKIKPTYLVQYCYYYPTQMGFVLAANKLKVISVDYQHGSQNKWHYAYGQWGNVPKYGYELMPKEFWVYSEREKSNLEQWGSKSNQLVKVKGCKIYEFWKKDSSIDKYQFLKQNFGLETEKVVLFTFSKILPHSEHYFWTYLKSLNNKNIFFLFRLHPAYLNNLEQLVAILNEIDFTNYEIEKSSSMELFDLLALVDVHITQNSFVAEEALLFGLKTIILDQNWKCYFEDYIEREEMYCPENYFNFVEIMNSQFSNIR